MNKAEEIAFERKAERYFRSHREIPNGRDFRWATYRFEDYTEGGKTAKDQFEKNFDKTFPGSPGSKEWFDRKFGGERDVAADSAGEKLRAKIADEADKEMYKITFVRPVEGGI